MVETTKIGEQRYISNIDVVHFHHGRPLIVGSYTDDFIDRAN